MSRPSDISRTWLIRASAALLVLALVYATTVAARNGLADLYSGAAGKFLQDSRDAGITLSEAEWQAVHTNLRRALSLEPNNPETLTELGRLHRIQLERDTLEPAEIERHGGLAISYYERAAMLRPARPWLWVSLAHVRWELYQDDGDAYHQALLLAMHFGSREAGVQRWVLRLTMDTWESLSVDVRQAVLAMIDAALELTPEALDAMTDSKWRRVCEAASSAAATDSHRGRMLSLSRLQRDCEARSPEQAPDLT